ncbi:MAG TPA: hypothetical protein PKO05_10215, partial [Thermoanaerobaculia bacterium]|nr:hypothetical protein [Thermoanaerobaculia bacterium]
HRLRRKRPAILGHNLLGQGSRCLLRQLFAAIQQRLHRLVLDKAKHQIDTLLPGRLVMVALGRSAGGDSQ